MITDERMQGLERRGDAGATDAARLAGELRLPAQRLRGSAAFLLAFNALVLGASMAAPSSGSARPRLPR
jgi:hypothetical protein